MYLITNLLRQTHFSSPPRHCLRMCPCNMPFEVKHLHKPHQAVRTHVRPYIVMKLDVTLQIVLSSERFIADMAFAFAFCVCVMNLHVSTNVASEGFAAHGTTKALLVSG